MRPRMIICRRIVFVWVVLCGVCGAKVEKQEFPPAEQAIQNDVDHWGLAFSDQVRGFQSKFAEFEKHAGEGKLDYVLGVETSLRKTMPSKYAFKGRITDCVELWAGRNESEAFQLAILPKMGFELKDVTVAVSDLTKDGGGAGQKIPSTAVELWRVGFLETQQPGYPTRHVGICPDPLIELEPFSLDGVDLGLVWCEVKVPTDAAAGDYHGTVTVRSSNSHELELTVKLHVWDFVLPDRVPMPMLVWTKPMSDDEYPKYFEMLLKHHVDPIRVGWIKEDDTRDKMIEFCLERGLMYFECIPFKDPKKFAPYYEHIKSKGWLDKAIVYAARDEPLKEQFEELVVPNTQQFRKEFPGVHVFLASQYYEGMGRGCDFLLLDVSTNFCSWLQAGRPGKQELWWYFCGLPIQVELERPVGDSPLMMADRDAIEHRIVYWMAHHYEVKGMFIYGGSLWPKDKDNTKWPDEPFKLGDKYKYPYAGHHNGNGFIIYPGPRPSIRLKTLRDGAEDYCYLNQVTKLAQSGKYAKEATSLLDSVRPDVFVDTHYFNRRPEVMLEFRHKLGHLIDTAMRHP